MTIHGFGLLLAAAVLVGLALFNRYCTRTGLDVDVGRRLTTWVAIGGLVGAHLFDCLFYTPSETLAHPLSLLEVWNGIASYGGLLGGSLGAWLFMVRHRQGTDTWRYLDGLAYALPFSFILGRLGCFLAFDHVGRATSFFLGERYADGVVRHNMGLEEALYWIVVATVIAVVGRRGAQRPGLLVALLALLYAPGRFLLDFLRISDERHAGLLVSQYGSIVLLAVGVLVLVRVVGRQSADQRPAELSSAESEPAQHHA